MTLNVIGEIKMKVEMTWLVLPQLQPHHQMKRLKLFSMSQKVVSWSFLARPEESPRLRSVGFMMEGQSWSVMDGIS
jgi:hypothetical protein